MLRERTEILKNSTRTEAQSQHCIHGGARRAIQPHWKLTKFKRSAYSNQRQPISIDATLLRVV